MEHSKALGAREQSSIEDQLGRFSIWTSNIGVFATRRASLDYRLRAIPDVQRLVIALLDALNIHLKTLYTNLQSRVDVSQTAPPETSSTVSEATLATEISNVENAVKAVADEISLLHQLSNTTRKASREAQNLKAASTFEIRDQDGNNVEKAFRDMFAMELVRRKFPQCGETIIKRLATSMLLRRKRILYRRSRWGYESHLSKKTASSSLFIHQKVPETLDHLADDTITQSLDEKEPSVAEAFEPAPSNSGSRAQTATTVTSEQFNRASAPSVAHRARTIHLSASDELIFPPPPKNVIMSKFNAMRSKREEEHADFLEPLKNYSIYKEHNGSPPLDSDKLENLITEIAKAEHALKDAIRNYHKICFEGEIEVICPYCCCTLSGHDVVDAHIWSRSDDWLKHMREHNMLWRCKAKAHGILTFQNRTDYEGHMKDKHKSCPLCQSSDPNARYEEHVAGHLRYLAIKSLPCTDEGDDEDCEDLSVNSGLSNARTRSTILEDPHSKTPLELDDNDEVPEYQLDTPPEPKYQSEMSEHPKYHEWEFIADRLGSSNYSNSDPILQALQSWEIANKGPPGILGDNSRTAAEEESHEQNNVESNILQPLFLARLTVTDGILIPKEPDSPDSITPRDLEADRFYDASVDALALQEALSHREDVNKKTLITVLPHLTAYDILDLRMEYKNRVIIEGKGVNLAKHIRLKLGNGVFGVACYATALGRWASEAFWTDRYYKSTLVEKDVHDLHQALISQRGLTAMIYIILRRSNTYLYHILSAYADIYKCSFTDEIAQKSQSLVVKALTYVLDGARSRPMRDAILLYQALHESQDTREKSELLISRLVRLHWMPSHLEVVKRHFYRQYNEQLEDAIAEEVSSSTGECEWGKFCIELARSSKALAHKR
ncbi:Annexin [Aspergillus ellipticus CBS 707.79]|uniref:Annexin n=1 Tax=Aspergillus ellipticus CBS 707.79 TaxID=1448320 RepID=A0A319D909_9EURO|nr:Annexin [Aspergillus ellipticus CBS 707.79]